MRDGIDAADPAPAIPARTPYRGGFDMLQIIEIAEGSFQLLDGEGRDVGWIRGTAFGFRGFDTVEDAAAAAVAGSRALATYLQRTFGASTMPSDPGAPLRLVHDGAYEWISRAQYPLARLRRPVAGRQAGAEDGRNFGLEFVLPSYVRAGAAISAAQRVHRAIDERDDGRAVVAPATVRESPVSAD
jgi:hypothetical protein